MHLRTGGNSKLQVCWEISEFNLNFHLQLHDIEGMITTCLTLYCN